MRNLLIWLFVVGSFIFSSWVMWHTFSYDTKSDTMLISDKVWSDFGWLIPLTRSFAYGQNWPPQSPLFPGGKIQYHFLFYAAVGGWEKLGLPIVWSMNILSTVGFSGILVALFILGKKWFGKYRVGILACVLFLFNGSLSWWPLKPLKQIITTTAYPAFGPWDGGSIAASWNWNIYTNQRHLGLSMFLGLCALYITNPLLLGLIMGVLLLTNQAIFASAIICLAWKFILQPKSRRSLIKSAIIASPFALTAYLLMNPSGQIVYKFGFLASIQFFKYWFLNLGIYLFLIPLAFYKSPRILKWLILPTITIFMIGNLFQLSPDMFNNHKLFNFILLVSVLFVANFLIKVPKWFLVFSFPFLILGGIVDFFPWYNDRKLALPITIDSEFVRNNIPPRAVILNSTWFLHPASLAGRSIFNGYTYFTWSHGYDSWGRETIQKAIYASKTKKEACKLLQDNNIGFVEINDHPEGFLQPNFSLWRGQFKAIYTNSESGVSFYDVATSCS